MRIGIDIRALMEGKTTGVQVYITNLLRALFEIDKANEYVLFGNSLTPPLIPPLVSPDGTVGARRGNVRHKIFRYPNKLFMPAQKYLSWPKIDKLLGGIDLFFSPHWRLVALAPQIPLVITFHDLSFEVMPEFFTLRQRLWHKFMDYRGAARRATKIIAVSKSTKQDLMDLYGVPERKIEVIYPGYGNPVTSTEQALKVFATSRADKSARYKDVAEVFSAEGGSASGGRPPMSRNCFLYFGTFEPRKNVAAVLEAYEEYYQQSRLKRPLVLAGSKGWKTKPTIPPNLKSQVKVLQNVSDLEKLNLYQGPFAFLFLSFYEGFGFPVLEAGSSSTPVISSFATSLSEIAGNFALLVNPMRPSQVVRAMLALEEDEKLYESLRNRALDAVKQFTWEKTARQTLELFEETHKWAGYKRL